MHLHRLLSGLGSPPAKRDGSILLSHVPRKVFAQPTAISHLTHSLVTGRPTRLIIQDHHPPSRFHRCQETPSSFTLVLCPQATIDRQMTIRMAFRLIRNLEKHQGQHIGRVKEEMDWWLMDNHWVRADDWIDWWLTDGERMVNWWLTHVGTMRLHWSMMLPTISKIITLCWEILRFRTTLLMENNILGGGGTWCNMVHLYTVQPFMTIHVNSYNSFNYYNNKNKNKETRTFTNRHWSLWIMIKHFTNYIDHH